MPRKNQNSGPIWCAVSLCRNGIWLQVHVLILLVTENIQQIARMRPRWIRSVITFRCTRKLQSEGTMICSCREIYFEEQRILPTCNVYALPDSEQKPYN